MRNRAAMYFEHIPNKYEEVFMDESKVYERLRYNKKIDLQKELKIPIIT